MHDTLNQQRVRRFQENILGRDFVVGDIHGSYDLVLAAMHEADFNPEHDRLFCVGDLVDRGKGSPMALKFLSQPYVFSVLGNHESMFLEMYEDGIPGEQVLEFLTLNNGMRWWIDIDPAQRMLLIDAFRKLPLVIEIESHRGTIGLLHAEVPIGMDWMSFTSKILAGDNEAIQSTLWGRTRAKRRDDSGVPGIGRIYCGHTPQWSGLSRLGNIYFLDTGAVFKDIGKKEDGRWCDRCAHGRSAGKQILRLCAIKEFCLTEYFNPSFIAALSTAKPTLINLKYLPPGIHSGMRVAVHALVGCGANRVADFLAANGVHVTVCRHFEDLAKQEYDACLIGMSDDDMFRQYVSKDKWLLDMGHFFVITERPAEEVMAGEDEPANLADSAGKPPHIVTTSQFARANEHLANWHQDGEPATIYRSAQARLKITIEGANSIDYVMQAIVHCDTYPQDSSVVFANGLVSAVRDHLSASDCYELALRFSQEVLDWQFEPGLPKPGDLFKELTDKLREMREQTAGGEEVVLGSPDHGLDLLKAAQDASDDLGLIGIIGSPSWIEQIKKLRSAAKSKTTEA